jgi:hypothetical protein
MSETIGRLLAAGQRAEVFEWGSRVVKLYRSMGSKRVAFREAAIHAALEATGLPVPSVWGVQQMDGRWGIVFDRVSGVSFAEQMRADPAALPQYLQILARLSWNAGHPALTSRCLSSPAASNYSFLTAALLRAARSSPGFRGLTSGARLEATAGRGGCKIWGKSGHLAREPRLPTAA